MFNLARDELSFRYHAGSQDLTIRAGEQIRSKCSVSMEKKILARRLSFPFGKKIHGINLHCCQGTYGRNVMELLSFLIFVQFYRKVHDSYRSWNAHDFTKHSCSNNFKDESFLKSWTHWSRLYYWACWSLRVIIVLDTTIEICHI